MDPRTEKDRLLEDVFADSASADFRATLLGETLRLAGRRRFRRRAQRAAALFVLSGLLALLVWRNRPQQLENGSPSYELVQTKALPNENIVITRPLAADRIITSHAGPEMVRTASSQGGCRLIDDDELLALVALRPAALVRVSPDTALLIFANPEDEHGFPVN